MIEDIKETLNCQYKWFTYMTSTHKTNSEIIVTMGKITFLYSIDRLVLVYLNELSFYQSMERS